MSPILAVMTLGWSFVVSIKLLPLDEEIVDHSELMLENGERDRVGWIEVDEEDGEVVLLDELVDFCYRDFVVLELLKHLVDRHVMVTFQHEDV